MDNKEQTTSQGIARWMFIAAWVLGLGLMTMLFDDQIERMFNPNQNTGNPVATDTEWRNANQIIFHNQEHQSRVILPVRVQRRRATDQ